MPTNSDRHAPRNGEPWTRDEDKVLEQFAGKKTAEEIGVILGRSKCGVHSRISTLGLKGAIRGEAHWAAKASDLQVQMITVLRDAGFMPAEIYRMFSEPLPISKHHVQCICDASYRRDHGRPPYSNGSGGRDSSPVRQEPEST